MFLKKFIPFYLEDLKFLITRCGWKVTKIYTDCTYEQARFKRDFVMMNQNYRQKAKNSIGKDFYKFMNNGNSYDDPFRNARITALENHNREEFDSLEAVQKKERQSKKRKLAASVETKLEEAFKNKKIKTMIDFDQKHCNSTKSIALKSDSSINVTSKYISGKMLMFAKVSLRSFIYDMIDVFCFPNEAVKEIYAYLILT